MFCEKAMELVRELHRAPEGQLPAFNVSSRGRACPGPGLGRGAGSQAWGRGQCGAYLGLSAVACLPKEGSFHVFLAGFSLLTG